MSKRRGGGGEWSTLTQNFQMKTWYNVEISTTVF